MLKDLYDKILTIGYYSGFYSSLNDKNFANGGHFGFLWKDEGQIFIMYVSNASLNLEKQMVIPFNISSKFEIMGYEKLSKFITSPKFKVFFKD